MAFPRTLGDEPRPDLITGIGGTIKVVAPAVDKRNMRPRVKVLAAGLTAVGAVVAGGLTYQLSEPADVFCNAYGIGAGLEDRVRHGDLVIIDHSWRTRDPCGDDDLWHYGELPGVDGVLFDDCRISWVGGGRTDADDVGLPCPS